MMNTKTIFSLLKKTTLSVLIVGFAIYLFGIIASGMNIMDTSAEFVEVLPLMIPFLLVLLFAFHYFNHQMQVRKLTHKAFPYFLYTIIIPTLISTAFSQLLMYVLKDKFNFILLLNHLATSGIIVVFYALFYYIKYNAASKIENHQETFLKIKIPYKEIILYAIGLSVFNGFLQSVMMFQFSRYDFLLVVVDSLIIAVICWHLVRFVNKYLSAKLSSSVLVFISIVVIVICMLPVIITIKQLQLFVLGKQAIPFTDFTIFQHIRFNLLFSIFVIFSVLFYQFLYFSKTRVVEQKAFKAAIGKQTEKYENLRRQLSPHFLFNNINVLTALIEENPQKAIHFSESLGNIYRHFLRQEDEDVVSLESALSFSKDYLELLKYRYEEAFEYILPKQVASKQYIIPLALQQVIENTIKHNEVSIEKPLQINIGIQDDYIIIQNTKQLKTQFENSKGTGIENIKTRYAFLTEQEVIVEDVANTFTIKLPLLKM